jgi:O-antigen/teichoic acid export membrane protein
MSSLRKLVSNTAIYGLGTILGRTINFLLVPIQTNVHVMTESTYGTLSELFAYAAFLNVLFIFGMETTYFRFVQRIGEVKAFNSAFSILLVVVVVLTSMLLLGNQSFAAFLGHPELANMVKFLTFILCIDALMALPFARLRQKDKAKKFAGIRLLNIGIVIFLNVFFLTILPHYSSSNVLFSAIYREGFALQYVIIANLIANAFFIPLLAKEFHGFRFYINKKIILPMLSFSWPLVVVGLSGMVNELIDRPMLRVLTPKGFYEGIENNDAVVGIYSACYKLSIFISMANQAFRYAAEPFFFSKAQDKNAPETFVKIMKYYVIMMCIAIVAISLARVELANIFINNEVMHKGLVVVPILLFANVLLGMYYNQSVWYKVTDKTTYGLLMSIVGVVITVVLNYLLIPIWGYLGSAVTTLACYAGMAVLSYYLGQKFYPIPYKLGNAFLHLLLALLFILPTYYFRDIGENTILIKTSSFLFYILVVYLIESKSFWIARA